MQTIDVAHNNLNVVYPLTPFFWETILPEKKDDKMQIIVKNDKYIADNVLCNTLEQWINALSEPKITYDNNGVSMLEIVFRTLHFNLQEAEVIYFYCIYTIIISKLEI